MKINQNFAKKVAIATCLTFGVIGYNSIFNETRAKLNEGSNYNYEDCCNPAGNNVGSCVAKTGGNCTTEVKCNY